ncbi:MAG: GntR family transcriptional regulator [Planctomycetota bacterium]|nr:GntR family transcriptional regulator [Planctomycetota bacterium]
MFLSINEHDPAPIYLQIVSQVKDQIAAGVLRPGDDLPGVRELADTLNINLHTVHRAYQKLRDDGLIHLRLGRRAKIAPLRESPPSQTDLESALIAPLNQLITEAYHLRLSDDDFRRLVDELLQTRKERSTRP